MTTATAPETTETSPATDTSVVSAENGTAPEAVKPEAGKTLLTTPTDEPKAFALALPDGSPLDPAVLTRITDLAQKAGVTDEKAAQEIVDLLHGEASATIESIKTAFAKDGSEWTKLVKAHEAAALADPMLGANDPAKLSVAVTEAKKALDVLAPEGFGEFLDETGLGSDPRFLKYNRAIYQRFLKEDALVKGNPMPPKPKTAAQRMFPNLPSEEG